MCRQLVQSLPADCVCETNPDRKSARDSYSKRTLSGSANKNLKLSSLNDSVTKSVYC